MKLEEFIQKAIEQPVRFKQHQSSFDGWDCWGLVCCAYKEVYNIDLPSYNKEYDNIGDKKKLAELFNYGKTKWIQVEKPDNGDVAICFLKGAPIHIGIIFNNKLLHIERGIETCLEKLNAFRIEGFYRHNERINTK